MWTATELWAELWAEVQAEVQAELWAARPVTAVACLLRHDPGCEIRASTGVQFRCSASLSPCTRLGYTGYSTLTAGPACGPVS